MPAPCPHGTATLGQLVDADPTNPRPRLRSNNPKPTNKGDGGYFYNVSAELQMSAELCRAVVNGAPDGILITRMNGAIAFTNPILDHMLGFESKELIGRPIELLVPESLRHSHVAHRNDFWGERRPRSMHDRRDLTACRKNGSELAVDISLSTVELRGVPHVVAIVRDVTEQRASEHRLRYACTHDQLTGTYNRTFFDVELERLVRSRGPVSIVICDIDGLKDINDARGHAAGDRVLERMAVVLRGAFRGEDIIARLGGDEFGILMPGTNQVGVDAALERLELERQHHNELYCGVPIRFSAGGAVAKAAATLRLAVRLADSRMYAVKRERHGRRSIAPA